MQLKGLLKMLKIVQKSFNLFFFSQRVDDLLFCLVVELDFIKIRSVLPLSLLRRCGPAASSPLIIPQPPCSYQPLVLPLRP